MQEPIEVKLNNSGQVALARLQDAIVEALVEVEPGIIFHGDTAIWRCYNGNRFSEDVDIYATNAQIRKLDLGLMWSLSKRNATMEYPTYTDRMVGIRSTDARSKYEAMKTPRGIRSVQAEYVRTDGSKLFVNTLSVKSFISEKIGTYVKRRYVRDFYDLYHLISIEKPDGATKSLVKRFLPGAERPIDESKLKDLVYTGIAPSFDTMKTSIEKAVS